MAKILVYRVPLETFTQPWMYKTTGAFPKLAQTNEDLICHSTQKPLQARPDKHKGSKNELKQIKIEQPILDAARKFTLIENRGNETLRKKEGESRISHIDTELKGQFTARIQVLENASQISSLSIDRGVRDDLKSRQTVNSSISGTQ
jgi:hypothetical protein